MNKKSVVVFSGGLDSTVLLYLMRSEGYQVHPISIFYGQRHFRELEHAKRTTDKMGIHHRIVSLSALQGVMLGNSQTDHTIAVPHGHYAEASMMQTVVPNRNMILLATAGALAISLKAEHIAYGAHAGDHAIYPDCRPEFFTKLGEALALADWHPVALRAPFGAMDKAGIVELGAQLQVPFEDTYSCYEGDILHCGKCGTCTERREAFREANVPDPTVYRD